MYSFDIYVIPNKIWKLSTHWVWEEWAEKLPNVTGDEMMVELWWYNSNDSRGSYNTTRDRGDGHEIISEFIPLRWVEGLKEGESKLLTFSSGTVRVTANQRLCYGSSGNFEDAVAMVTA